MTTHSLLGICGSLREGSLNRKLLREAARLYAPNAFEEGDIRLPLYDGDVEASEGVPDAVLALAGKIRGADAVIVSTPEYNKMISGVLKNALDWLSRVEGDVWTDKPVAVMSATAGRTGGEASLFTLRHALAAFRPHLLAVPAPMVAAASGAFDGEGRLADERYAATLGAQMAALRAVVDRRRSEGV